MMKRFFTWLFIIGLIIFTITECKKDKKNDTSAVKTHIGVFVPGVSSGSPVYEMLVNGVEAAAVEFNINAGSNAVQVTVIEGGYNQSEWENKITAMAASITYDLIVSSNPSLPDIVANVSAKFPNQHFLLLDGELSGNPRVYTLRYNQHEQAYMAGYLAALETERYGIEKVVGLVAAQEYPVMNEIILPSFTQGAKAVNAAYQVDFRIVGNWHDAVRAGELAADIIRGGARVVLTIAGGANEGVVSEASKRSAKVIWFDDNGYNIKPGTIIGSSVIRQDLAAFNKVLLFLNGELPFGSAEIVGVNDGYVDFIQDDPIYIETVNESIRQRQDAMIQSIRSGKLVLGKE